MKWIVLFCSWLSSSTNNEVISLQGAIVVSDSVLNIYVHPYQYVDFKIEKSSEWTTKGDSKIVIANGDMHAISYGTFYLSHQNGHAVLTVTPQLATFYYYFEKDGVELNDFAYIGRKIFNENNGTYHCYLDIDEKVRLRRKKLNSN